MAVASVVSERPIGIMCAMEIEGKLVKAAIENPTDEFVDPFSIPFTRGTFGGREVIFVYTGVGESAAVLNAGLLLTIFNVRHVVRIGTAGAGTGVKQGDIVVASLGLSHDRLAEGFFPLGFLEESSGVPQSPSDLQKRMERASRFAMQTSSPSPSKPNKVVIGPTVSGNTFIATYKKRQEIQARMSPALGDQSPKAYDMETAAIFRVCAWANKSEGSEGKAKPEPVRVAAVSVITDSVEPGESEAEAPQQFLEFTTTRAQPMLLSILRHYIGLMTAEEKQLA